MFGSSEYRYYDLPPPDVLWTDGKNVVVLIMKSLK